jgi:hypothetical protein
MDKGNLDSRVRGNDGREHGLDKRSGRRRKKK